LGAQQFNIGKSAGDNHTTDPVMWGLLQQTGGIMKTAEDIRSELGQYTGTISGGVKMDKNRLAIQMISELISQYEDGLINSSECLYRIGNKVCEAALESVGKGE
jgi:hypothetical protein